MLSKLRDIHRYNHLPRRIDLIDVSTDVDWMLKLLEFCSGLPGLMAPEVRKLKLDGRDMFSVALTTRYSEESKQSLTNSGRSDSSVVALAKAYAETLERFAAIDISQTPVPTSNHKLTLNGKSLVVTELTNPSPLILPMSLRTSNGWAVHRSADLAVWSAFLEAVERHLLIMNFSGNTRSFEVKPMTSVLSHPIDRLEGSVSQNGLNAFMIRAGLKNHRGCTLGFGVDWVGSADQARTDQAIFEAIEPAVHFDKLLGAEIENVASRSLDHLDVIQALTALGRVEIKTGTGCEEDSQRLPDIETNVSVFNLAEAYGCQFPLFAAFVHGGNLVPLVQGSQLRGEQEFSVYAPLRKAYGSNFRIPDVHPVI